MNKQSLLPVLLVSICFAVNAQKQITVLANKPVTNISPTMWGIFFRRHQFYSRWRSVCRIGDRSFEFYNPMMGWAEIKGKDKKGKILFINLGPKSPQNTLIARVTIDSAIGSFGLSNEGFRGMGVRANNRYNFSIKIS